MVLTIARTTGKKHAESSDAALKEGIAAFYDASSGVWEEVWGEHMHHGYYGPDGSARKDHRQAQVARRQPLVVLFGEP